MKSKRIYKKNPNFVTRQIDTELIMMPLVNNSKDIGYLYTLNEPAQKAWKMIDGLKSWEQIKEGLREEFLKNYDTTLEEINKELGIFLKDLKQIKAVEEK